jgi:hypothetical protein
MRDTAYACTPKARRESWHTFLAGCLANGHGTDESAPDHSLALAYHVEAACQFHRDLRAGDPALPALAPAAADVLIGEGMKALSRKDLPAAAALLERGRVLMASADERHTQIALHISDCWLSLMDESRALAALSAAEAVALDDRRSLATCAIQRCIVALRLGLASPDSVAEKAQQIAAGLEADPEDDLSWCRYHQLRAHLLLAAERAASAVASLRLALARARAMEAHLEEERLLCAICELGQWTPEDVNSGLGICAELAARFATNRALLVPVLVTKAYLIALTGDLEGARKILATTTTHSNDLHLDISDAAIMDISGFVESLAGAHEIAAACYRRAAAILRATPLLHDVQMMEVAIARELLELGRTAESADTLDRLQAAATPIAPRARIVIKALRARIASAQDRHGKAAALASELTGLADQTDDPYLAGTVMMDAAGVLRAAGRQEKAAESATQALELFRAKGATLQAERVRRWLNAAPDLAAPDG